MCNKESGQSKLFFIISNSLLYVHGHCSTQADRQWDCGGRFHLQLIGKTAKLFTCMVLRFLTQTILYHINDFYL